VALEMTIDEFRKMALGIPTAIERSHMNHPDFRVAGKIFASLGVPGKDWGMVKLTLEQQHAFIEKAPKVFKPCSGAWGRQGATNVYLPSATASIVRAALNAAAKNVASKKKKTPSAQHPMVAAKSSDSAKGRFGKTRSRKSAETGRARFRRFEIGD
jgi:hypothetical protein